MKHSQAWKNWRGSSDGRRPHGRGRDDEARGHAGDYEAADADHAEAPDYEDDYPRRRRKGRPRKRDLTPEERAYRDARSAANRKLGFATHALAYGGVLSMLLVITRSLAVVMIVGASWGIGLASHGFFAVVVPTLRRRWIDEEVGRRVRPGTVRKQRREIEDRHLRSLEDLSASIAHEIRNPITAAKSLVAQMGEDPTSSENIEYAGVALGELDRVERSISHLLKYARDEELRFEWVAFGDVVDAAVATFADRLRKSGVQLELDVDAAGTMHGDPEKLRRVVINLVGNALDALEEAGTQGAQLTVSAGENLAGSELWLRVRDNGPGVDAQTRDRIFSPFYTTKVSGTGLGLALAKKAVDAHGGYVELISEPGSGAEFVVILPKHSESSRSAGDAT